jgi:hypothetical protein
MVTINELLFDTLAKIILATFFFSLSMVLTVVSFVFGSFTFYLASASLWVTTSVYLMREFLHLRYIRNNFPLEDDGKVEPLTLDLEDDDLALQVCLLYRNGASFPKIKRDLGFSHPTAVQRLLRKGLDVLLKTYKKEVKNQND